MPSDVVRESFVGQLIYIASGRRLFRYAEEQPDFVLPEQYAKLVDATQDPEGSCSSEASSITARDPSPSNRRSKASKAKSLSEKSQVDVQSREASRSRDGRELEADNEDVARTHQTMETSMAAAAADPEKGNIAQVQQQEIEEEKANPYIVDWYSANDPENPRNVRTHRSLALSPHSHTVAVVVCQTLFCHL